MNAHRPPRLVTASQALCRSCGLCCDGSLFAGVDVDAAERSGNAPPDLPQPCPHHRAGACAIYADRPRQCRAFTCRVLQAVEDGSRTRDWAETRIAAMRHLLAGLDQVLPGEGGLYGRAAAFLEDERAIPDDARIRARIAVYAEMIGDFRPLSDPETLSRTAR